MASRLSPAYRPRRPHETALYAIVREHLDAFVQKLDAAGRSLPAFVLAELEGFLRCGDIRFGCAIHACTRWGHGRVLPFSCGGRGFCPSCLGRRMAETSAHLVDDILPRAPVRQWVLSYPMPLRFVLAYNAEACSVAVNVFVGEVFRYLRHKAKQELGLDSVELAHPGSVTVIQRAGGAGNCNPHPHLLALDGVYICDGPGTEPTFHALPAPSRGEVLQVGWMVAQKTLRALRSLGISWDPGTSEQHLDLEATPDPVLAELASLGAQNLSLDGQRLLCLGVVSNETELALRRPAHGFDVHAGVRVAAHDRRRLHKLCQYILRPPLSHDRIEKLPDGRVRLRLKRPWQDGTTHLVMSPLDLLSRLAAMVPPPRMHQLRYHGILAPHAKHRAAVVPPRQPKMGEQLSLLDSRGQAKPPSTSATPKLLRIGWAKLLRRTMGYDDLDICPKCQGRMKVTRFVFAQDDIAEAIRQYGSEDDHATKVRVAYPARAPPPAQLALPLPLAAETSTRRMHRPTGS